MKHTRVRSIAIVALVAIVIAAIAFPTVPATAGTTSTTDASGVDYDAACRRRVTDDRQPTGPRGAAASTPNSVDSPGTAGGAYDGGDGCWGETGYDGNTESTDLASVSLSSGTNASTGRQQLVASWTVGHPIATAGSTTRGSVELPDADFTGTTYFALFRNKSKQTNTDNIEGGCRHIGTDRRIRDQHGAWQDGYHFFVAFGQNWDGIRWVHSAQIGEYDPSPDGGFLFTELGVNDGIDDDGDGSAWDATDTLDMPHGSSWLVTTSGSSVTVSVDGIVLQANELCDRVVQSPYSGLPYVEHAAYRTAYATPGDVIADVKGLTTANKLRTLDSTVVLTDRCDGSGTSLLDICQPDLRTLGGYAAFSDTTSGTSYSAGGLCTCVYPAWVEARRDDIPGIAYTPGLYGSLGAHALNESLVRPWSSELDDHRGSFGPLDTLGDGMTCPTPTLGGLIQQNPLFTSNQSCQIDDDTVARGWFFGEFWETVHSFIF